MIEGEADITKLAVDAIVDAANMSRADRSASPSSA